MIRGFVLAVLAMHATADGNPCDSTAPPEPTTGPAPAPAPGPCDTTPALAPEPAPAPAPSPGCIDRPSDWKSTEGSTCADYGAKQWCTADGGYGSGWKVEWGKFDKWAMNGVPADVACCVCGGGSTVSGEQACQGHSYDKNACTAVGCCYYSVLFGCRANDGDAQCYSGEPCGTTTASGADNHGKGKVIGGLVAGGVVAGAIGAAMAAKKTTTAGPGPSTTASAQSTQGAQTTAPTAVTTSTENSSSSLLWLWILLGILALCCLLALCGGGVAAMMGGKKKKKKTRATRISQPAPVPVVEPIVEERQELLPMVPPLLEPMAVPTMMETVQMVPMATPTMVETTVPTMQTVIPLAASAMPAMTTMQMPAPAATSMMPVMHGIGGYGTQAF